MRKITLLLVTTLLLSTVYSCKKINNKAMVVLKDCTGAYLQFKGKDYRVCNLDMVATFADKAKVNASFRKIKNCTDSGQSTIGCKLYHKNEGWITIERIE